jgi:hypothetical protein
MMILEKNRKKYQILINNDKEILVTTFECRLKGEMGTVLQLNRTCPHSHLNRTKEESEGTTAAAVVPALVVLAPNRASQASSAANETTATFDLTHKHDKLNQILSIKN